MNVTCPKCLRLLLIADDPSSSTVTCPACRSTLHLSAPRNPAPSPLALRWSQGANLEPCPDCGLPVSSNAVFCPHCGSPVSGAHPGSSLVLSGAQAETALVGSDNVRPANAVGKSHQGTAIVGFVLSLLGFGLIALIVCLCALSGMDKSGNEEGKGWATAGAILGALEIVAVFLLVLAD